MIARTKMLLTLILTSVLLSGCYVYAVVIPATPDGDAPVDYRLQGTWSVLKADGRPDGTLLHFMVPGDGGPMRMVSTNSQDYGVFEVHPVQVDDMMVFAMRKLPGPASGRAQFGADATMFVLGTYRIDGETLSVRTYDAKVLAAAVDAGHIKGKVMRGGFPQSCSMARPKTSRARSRRPRPAPPSPKNRSLALAGCRI
jgi:hypothetical protein